jgi:hypothetical protein
MQMSNIDSLPPARILPVDQENPEHIPTLETMRSNKVIRSMSRQALRRYYQSSEYHQPQQNERSNISNEPTCDKDNEGNIPHQRRMSHNANEPDDHFAYNKGPEQSTEEETQLPQNRPASATLRPTDDHKPYHHFQPQPYAQPQPQRRDLRDTSNQSQWPHVYNGMYQPQWPPVFNQVYHPQWPPVFNQVYHPQRPHVYNEEVQPRWRHLNGNQSPRWQVNNRGYQPHGSNIKHNDQLQRRNKNNKSKVL